MEKGGPEGRDVFGFVREHSELTRARTPSRRAPDPIPVLTQRVAELEDRIRTLEAELEAERRSQLERAETGRSMLDVLADVQRSVASIRQEQSTLADQIASLRSGALGAVFASPAIEEERRREHANPGADAKNALLDELFASTNVRTDADVLQVMPAVAPPIETAATASAAQLLVADVGIRQIQVVVAPIHSFPRLLAIEHRIRSLSTVNALYLRDFRNGMATFSVSVSEAISPAEFGAVIQMIASLELRLEGSTSSSVELRAEPEPPAS